MPPDSEGPRHTINSEAVLQLRSTVIVRPEPGISGVSQLARAIYAPASTG